MNPSAGIERDTRHDRHRPSYVGRKVTVSLAKPSVAVFDADAAPALAFARSIGRRGVAVRVHATDRFSVACFSRYVATRHQAPPVNDAAAFLPFLIEQLRAEATDLIAPTSNLVAFYLSCIHDLLGPRMRAVLPSREAILDVLLEDRFHARCHMLGQPTPHTLWPTSLAEAMDLASQIVWPAILKPRSHIGVDLTRAVLVTSRDELAREFKPYVITPGNLPIVAQAPAIRWPLIQEYIPDALQNRYSVSGLLGKNGEVIAASTSRKSTQWPRSLGVGTSFSAHDDPYVTELGVSLARQILGRGIFEIELIHDRRHDRWVATELNPRASRQIALDIARGHDLPGLWYRMALGERLAPQEGPTSDVRWLHAVVHGLRDPLPQLVIMAKMLGHPGGLVRSFLGGSF